MNWRRITRPHRGAALPAKFNSPDIDVTRTDWQDAIFRTGALSNNAVSVNGGTDHILYNFSAGYINQESVVQNYQYRAANFRIGLEERIGIFRFGQSLNAQFIKNTGNSADLTAALYMPPYFDIYDPTRLGGFTAATNVKDLSNAGNPLAPIFTKESTNRNYLLYPQFFGRSGQLNRCACVRRSRCRMAVIIRATTNCPSSMVTTCLPAGPPPNRTPVSTGIFWKTTPPGTRLSVSITWR